MDKTEHAETIGVFTTEEALINAIDKLYESGFERHDISIQGDPSQLTKTLGQAYIAPEQIEENPKAPRRPPELPEEYHWKMAFTVTVPAFLGMIIGILMVGGVLADTIVLILGITIGGLIGAAAGGALGARLRFRHQSMLKKQFESGGIVLWVKTISKQKIKQATQIFNQFGARDVHTW